MSPHKKGYYDYYGITVGDWWPCEYCGKSMVDVHAIDADGIGGTKKEHLITNLMAICREDHHEAHNGTKLPKEFLKEVHLQFMETEIPYLQLKN